MGEGASRHSVLVVGGTGRLGPHVLDALDREGIHVVHAARRRSVVATIAGVDVEDPQWWQPEVWRAALRAEGVCAGQITAVVNLVASRARTRRRAIAVGLGAARSLMAAARASDAADVLSIQVGSIAELRHGRLPPYAAGKAAARAEAVKLGVTAVLTVGVIPRPRLSRQDALLRSATAVIPEMAALPMATSTAGEVGAAVAYVVSAGRDEVLRRGATTEVVLAGCRHTLGDVLGVRPHRRIWSRAAFDLLAHTRGLGHPSFSRVTSCARIARHRAPRNHYMATAAPYAQRSEWRLMPGPTGLMLVPPKQNRGALL